MTDEDAKRLAEIQEAILANPVYYAGPIGFLLRLLDEALAERQWQPCQDCFAGEQHCCEGDRGQPSPEGKRDG